MQFSVAHRVFLGFARPAPQMSKRLERRVSRCLAANWEMGARARTARSASAILWFRARQSKLLAHIRKP
jgi:hypothetical protein